MRGPVYKIALGVVLWAMLGGCAEDRGPVILDTAGIAPAVDYSELDAVLGKSVRKDGLLDVAAAVKCAEQLDAQLKRLTITGPTVTPQLLCAPQDALAYWYNARAAWSMKLAALADFPDRLDRARLSARVFTLDNRQMTLEDVDTEIAACGGWEALVAAPGICIERAQLPRSAFSAEDIRQRINTRFNGFIDDDRRFTIDIARKQIDIPTILYQFHGQLIQQHNQSYGTSEVTLTTALLPYVSGSAHRRLQDAVGYICLRRPPGGKLAIFKDE